MRKFFSPLFILVLLALLIVNCRPNPPVFPTNPYAGWSLSDPGLQRRSLNFPLGESWDTRSRTLDQTRLETLIALNKIDGIEEIPVASPIEGEFANLLTSIRKSFPDKVNEQFNQYLFSIYFVKNLGSSGLTGIIRYNQDPIGGIVFIDTDLLSQNANEWATAKEKTVFSFSGNEDLKVILEKPEDNNKANALAFILLHEFGHILATVEKHAPDFSLPKRDFRTFPYFKDFWISEIQSEHDQDIKDRNKIKFYSKSKIPFGESGLSLYEELEDTPFVTLYAATNADDSFSEAYASFVHIVLQGKPYEVLAIKGNESKKIFENGIIRSEGKSQKLYFNKIFGIKD
jgi:hypothetical protein